MAAQAAQRLSRLLVRYMPKLAAVLVAVVLVVCLLLLHCLAAAAAVVQQIPLAQLFTTAALLAFLHPISLNGLSRKTLQAQAQRQAKARQAARLLVAAPIPYGPTSGSSLRL